jgi:SAM-dependent methyltransferase
MHVFDSDTIPAELHPKYPQFRFVPPLPSVFLMDTIGASSIENFYVVGEAWSHVVSHFAAPGATVLDIGCGVGRTARFLLQRKDLRYIGFDVIKSSIDWALTHLRPLTQDRFDFVHLDVFNAHYNAKGRPASEGVRFPAADAQIDVAFAASLFTHLLEPDAITYLRESARCLTSGGKLLASLHIEPPAGGRFVGQENRIDVDPDYFKQLASNAGLRFAESIGPVCGQETLVFAKP